MSEIIAEPPPSRRLWALSAAAALAIHLGCVALAVAHMQTDELADDLGAPAIEIGLDLSSPHREATDLPPGPDTDASVASPALAEQKAVEKETDLPKDTPTETAEPDRIVTETDSKKPVDDDPEKAAKPTTASQESAASEATAMPSVENAQEFGAFGRAAARHRRKRAPNLGHLAEGIGGSSRQAQALSA